MFHKPNYTRYRQPIHGFTLVELLVVISIIALLLSILIPSLSRVREAAKETVCKAHLQQFGIAAFAYSITYNDNWPFQEWVEAGVPPKYIERSVKQAIANALKNPDAEANWCKSILPFLGENKDIFYCPSTKVNPMEFEGAWTPDDEKYTIAYLYNGAAIRVKVSQWRSPAEKILIHDQGSRRLGAVLRFLAGKYYWNKSYENYCDYPYPWYSDIYSNLEHFTRSRDALICPVDEVRKSWNVHSHGGGNYGRNLLLMDGHVEWHKWGTFIDMYLPEEYTD